LTVHVHVHIDVPKVSKTQITELYKHTNMHTICELWILSTFINNSYTNNK
jgi:hypothetical protein